MLYSFDTRIPNDWVYIEREKEITKTNQNGILFDGNTKQFLDFSLRPITIKGEVIFPRTGSTQIYEMNEEIMKQGGIPVLTNNEIYQVNDWPNYYCGNRKLQVLKGKDLVNEDILTKIENEYGKEFFLKTKEKNFSSIIPIRLLLDKECVFYKALLYHLEEEFIISEKMDLVRDQYGTKEYRCIIRNYQVMNISRMTDTVLHQIDKSVYVYANKIAERLREAFPSDYVLDIVEKQKNGQIEMDIVEINPIHCSGLYLYNSMLEQSRDILHENVWNLPAEWESNKEMCKLEGKMIENRDNLYNCRNSFSSDIRSIYLTGSRGLLFSEQKEFGIEEFAHRGIKKTNFIEITDDFDLANSELIQEDDCNLNRKQQEKCLMLLKDNKMGQ